ncbi:universal stress protein [Niveispirillum fermenti]|uniref:universal stress protein n=1 Tax=Niveispirillum fermenti TaxID=1233113 RepID=UPI003A841F40
MTNETPPMAARPRRLLLATDLSARCDRALDRALLLANEWQAELILLHVVEPDRQDMQDERDTVLPWRRPDDPVQVATREIETELRRAPGPVAIMVEKGDVSETVQRVASERACDLIITGLARSEVLGRFSLGTSVEKLARRAPAPVLVVRNRARETYQNVLVTTDFAAPSRRALQMAAHLFPQQSTALLHAFQTPFVGIVRDQDQMRDQYRTSVQEEAAAFVASAELAPDAARKLRVLAEEGAPADLVRDYVAANDTDLVVLGTDDRGSVLDFLMGSTTDTILEVLRCDALIVGCAVTDAAP